MSRPDTLRQIEGHSTAMGTALNYVALRLLGVPAEHPVIVQARATLHKLGGHIPQNRGMPYAYSSQVELLPQPLGANSGFLS